MRQLIILLYTFVPVLVFSKTVEILRLPILANSEKIALVEIIVVSDTAFTIKVLDNIKGTDEGEIYEINIPKLKYYPHVRFSDYSVGEREIIFFQNVSGYQLRSQYGESELLFRNDSVFIKPDAFRHGCYNVKYRISSPEIEGIKMQGFHYSEFKAGINLIDSNYSKFRKLLISESEIQNEKKRYVGYNPHDGVVPQIKNKKLIKFRNQSDFQEYLLDLMIDEVLTTNF